MARECAVCSKRQVSGNNVSHSNRKTKRTFKPNLQKVDVDGGKKYVCVRCIRTMNKDAE